MIRLVTSTFAALAALSISTLASAQTAPPPTAPPPGNAPPPGYYYPPPPPARGSGVHMHDGFYLRMGFGLGYMSTSETGAGDVKVKGMGSGYLLSIGGTPIPGLAIGGSLFTHVQPKPSLEVGGTTGDASKGTFLLTLGPIVDGYPDPAGGFHVGGGLLYSSFNAVNYTSTGYAAQLFTGYDFWIGDQWSFGPMLQLTASKTAKDPANDTSTSIVVLATIVDH